MEMFFVILLTSVPVLVLGFLAAYGIKPANQGNPAGESTSVQSSENADSLAQSTPRFFAGDVTGTPGQSRLPVEVLRRQIEAHVRLEQAAAESFRDVPSRESLHSRSVSPFMN